MSREGLLALFVISMLGCANPAPPDQEPTREDEAELAAIQRELAAGRWDYETGLELVASGEDRLGEDVILAASRRLEAAAERCARLPICESAEIEASLASFAHWKPPHTGGDGARDATPADARTWPRRDLLEQIELNDHVLAAINEWLTWRSDDLADSRRHYRALRSVMAPVYEEEGLPEPLLFAQMATESAGKVHAYSRSGAVGPLQFMRVTALRYGLRTIEGFDTRLDPVAATRANADYVKRNLKLFDDDIALVMAAYNGGETRMLRLQRRHPDASFWDERIYYALPRETRRHVPRVFAAALIFMHPEDYGLEVYSPEDPIGKLTLDEPMALGEIAVCVGNEGEPRGWFRTLRNLNPSLDPSERLDPGSVVAMPARLVATYARSCGTDTRLKQKARVLHDAEYPEKPPVEEYVVQRGDTLNEIVERFPCTTLSRLARMNGIKAPNYVIQPGQKLTVPRCP
jgi:membrane-bound lytic murein transglycosylase D